MKTDTRHSPATSDLVVLLATVKRLRDAEQPTRPLRAALPRLRLALPVLAVGLAVELRWLWIVVTACSLVVVALLRAGRASIALRQRRAADEWSLWQQRGLCRHAEPSFRHPQVG